jgi:O-antigen ligase
MSAGPDRSPEAVAALPRAAAVATGLAHAAFHLFLIVSLTTPSWRYGLYQVWPVASFEELAGGPVDVGVLNLLPVIIVAGWAAGRLLSTTRRALTPGPRWLALPFLGLTLLGLVSLQPEPFRRFFLHVSMLALAWLVYLFAVNERPRVTRTLALVLAVLGAVAIGQFVSQGDLGLRRLGELPLDPAIEGISVIIARGQPWLRAYGLTAHPNLLAAILVVGLLLVLPTRAGWRGFQQVFYWAAIGLGLAGLFFSFSRGGWLAFAAGLLVWALLDRASLKLTRRHAGLALAALACAAFLLVAYGDLVYGRFFNLDTPTEAQSINQRLQDAHIALAIIRDAPWLGVGMGNYSDAALLIDRDSARVHNVALFVTAELGLAGLALWLWLMIGPLWVIGRRGRRGGTVKARTAALCLAPWVAMLVSNSFDTMLWLTSNWQTSIVFALLLANVVRPLAGGEMEP